MIKTALKKVFSFTNYVHVGMVLNEYLPTTAIII